MSVVFLRIQASLEAYVDAEIDTFHLFIVHVEYHTLCEDAHQLEGVVLMKRETGQVKGVAAVLMIIILFVSFAATVQAYPTRKALILSSIEKTLPSYSKVMARYLSDVGYSVTILNDTAVTVDVLMHRIGSYEIVVWRTDAYDWMHTTYWYVGELATTMMVQKYAADFAAGYMDYHSGIAGVSEGFFHKYFTPGSLGNIRLMIVEASMSSAIALAAKAAGVPAAVFYYNPIDLSFGYYDSITSDIVELLTLGYSVQCSVEGAHAISVPWRKPVWWVLSSATCMVHRSWDHND